MPRHDEELEIIMQVNIITKLLLLILLAAPLMASRYDHIKNYQQGEYYEYDLEGSHCNQVKRQIGFRTKQVIKTPFKLVRRCYRTSKDVLKGTINSIELFLSDSQSINGHRREFAQAMADFEGSAAVSHYYAYDQDEQDGQCLFGLPTALWKIFKSALYTVGFRFPRATWHTIKRIFHGASACVKT